MARFLVLLIALAICTLVAAAPEPPRDTRDYLMAHNKARAAAKVGPLVWSLNLALKASQIVKDQSNLKSCNFTKLADEKYGVNQWRSVGLIGCKAQDVVNQWLEEKENYDNETKTCEPNKECRSYIQVVARNSVFLGCAEATCNGTTGGCLAVCLYNPPAKQVA